MVSVVSPRMLFSVLIANYNNGRFLEEALQSVFRQTYTDWEIVLVDDGSTDGISEKIYQKYTDPQSPSCDKRIHLFRNNENRGCGYTKWRCAEEARGELCGFLDPDDALTPDALEVMVAEHGKHPEVAVIGSCYWCVDEQMNKLWHSEQKIIPEGQSWLTTTTTHAPIHFASYKGKRYRQTEGINPKLKRAVDFDLYVKLEEQGGIHFISAITYYYRMHDNQISTSGDFKSLYWQIYVIIKACERRNISAENVVDSLLKDNWQWYIYNGVGYQVPKKKMPILKRLVRKISRMIKRMCL